MDRVPLITREDVLRVVRRDFPNDDAIEIVSNLDQYGQEPWQLEKDRVQLAILKLSRGDLHQLRNYVGIAQQDYREVLGPAEFPYSFPLAASRGAQADTEQLSELQKEDWQQHEDWLRSEEYCGGPLDPLLAQREAAFFQVPLKRKCSLPGWAALILGPLVGMLLALPAILDRDNAGSLVMGPVLHARGRTSGSVTIRRCATGCAGKIPLGRPSRCSISAPLCYNVM